MNDELSELLSHRVLAEREVERCRLIAASRYMFEGRPQIDWEIGSRRVAGRAYRGTAQRIVLNPHFALEQGPEFRETVAHEVAHIVAFQLWPRATPHGREWRMVMAAFGYANASPYHAYATPQSLRTTKRR